MIDRRSDDETESNLSTGVDLKSGQDQEVSKAHFQLKGKSRLTREYR